MSRAAILPYPGDPFLLNFWLRFYDTVWGDEVDKLYIYLNSPIEAEVVEYIRDRIRRSNNTVLLYEPQMADHGASINKTLDHIDEEFLMLIEDDAIVFRSGMVDMCFGLLESGKYDIVGSKRGSCALEIIEAAQKKWNIPETPYGDNGPNFWPCYFFSKTETLKATTRHFGARAWNKGEKITPLDYDVEVPVVNGDTFVNTSLELRAMIPEERIYYVPQYHLHPDDWRNFERGLTVFDGKAPWLHIGSLSSGVTGILRDDQNRPLASRLSMEPKGPTVLEPWANTEMEKQEWERRICFWLMFWDNRELDKIVEFADAYKAAIDQVIWQYHLNIKNILKMQSIYKSLGL